MIGRLLPAALLALAALPAQAQQLDLSHGGPIGITARDGIEWRQAEQQVIARGDARAVRDQVTVTGDVMVAWYRKKSGAPQAAQPQGSFPGDPDAGGTEIFRVQADGNVHIFTQTDQAQGDRATYDLDQAVLVMTGRDLKLTTPNEVLTARDTMEYWAQKHMAVARGNAVVVTKDARRIAADTLVAYTTGQSATATPVAAKPAPPEDPLAASGKLEKVEAFGNVSVRTVTDTVTGERAVYMPDTGIARVAGNVRITRGQNQLNGAEANVDMKTGIARLLSGTAGRVQGLVVPNDETNKGLTSSPTPPPAGAKR